MDFKFPTFLLATFLLEFSSSLFRVVQATGLLWKNEKHVHALKVVEYHVEKRGQVLCLKNCWMIGFFGDIFKGRCLWSEEIMVWKWRWCKTPKFMIESQSYWGSVLANASQLTHKANCQLPFSWYFGSTVEALENRKQINTFCQPIAYIGSNPQVHSGKWRFIQISLLKNVWPWQIQSFKLDSNGWLGSQLQVGTKERIFSHSSKKFCNCTRQCWRQWSLQCKRSQMASRLKRSRD